MDWLVITVNEFRHVFSVLIAELLLVLPSMEKRRNFKLRISLCVVLCCILSPLYAIFYIYLHDSIIVISIFWYTLIFVATGAVIAICFKIKFNQLLWVMIAAYAVEHFVYVLINEIIFIGIAEYSLFQAESKLFFWVSLLVYTAVCAVTYYGFYRIFKPNVNHLGLYLLHNKRKNSLFFGVLLVVFFASTLLNQQNAQIHSDGFNYISAVSDLINCLFVLIVQFIGLISSRVNYEKQMAESVIVEGKRQYEAFKNSVDYINIKCHDLKHELAAMRAVGTVDVKKLEEAESNLALYEAFAKTGNETLDILLTEKNLLCLSKGIVFSYMADASMLNIMSVTDIYVLFGNLLDNAVEYLQKVKDESNKFIRLFIKPQGNLLLIHQENYFCDDITLKDGLPRSTKGDLTNHGFGMKSMRQTAKKYGGDLRTSVDDGLFKVDVYIRI